MDRLVKRIGHGIVMPKSIQLAMERLAAYEDTGLMPDEIPKWTPVSEKPKVSDQYLVLTEEGDMFNADFDKDCGDDGEFGIWQNRYDEHTLGFLDSEWSSYGGITHWMPLPQPPKDKP